MLKEWQFNVLFFVGVGGAIFLLVGPSVGLNISNNPVAVTGVGAILTYVLTQKQALTRSNEKDKSDNPRQTTEVGDDGL